MAKKWVLKNIAELMTLKGVHKKQGRKPETKDLSILKKGALVIESGVIQWIGAQTKLPSAFKKYPSVDCKGRNVFPGFVDCHTHMVFAGDRQNEFELRNQGVSYQEIAKKGGGILSTMKATRKASEKTLVDLAQERVNLHLSQRVTSIEVKSGYGLNTSTEEKMLSVAKKLKKARITTTFLGAHAIPKEFKNETQYLQSLKKDLVNTKKKGLSSRVDIFIEKGYFTAKLAKDYLQYALDLGFEVTIHADQLSHSGATSLAVELGALSADHVICSHSQDIKKLSQSETTAVFLPAADFYLQCEYPKARKFIEAGASFALATDFNPGSSPTQNISLVGLLSRLEMKMTLPEVFTGLTYGGAMALGKENEVGCLLPGYKADFFISSKKWSQFFYDLSGGEVEETFVNGSSVYRSSKR